MFSYDFFPTPSHVIDQMLEGLNLENKFVLEPSAGRGDIIDRLKSAGAKVICCESNKDLALIAASKCSLIANDFLTVTSQQVSHINFIIMNPPFSSDEKHILHAWDIAPPGCKIVALCNFNTIDNANNRNRRKLFGIIQLHGNSQNIGGAFTTADRKTKVNIGLIHLTKPGGGYEQEFSGFLMEEEPEKVQENGIMKYDAIEEIVTRYINAVKLFDKQIELGIQMMNLISPIAPKYYDYDNKDQGKIEFLIDQKEAPNKRAAFKKSLQMRSWLYIFDKMNLEKYATKGLKSDINKFIQQQKEVPFTMKNIYHMLDIIIQTTGQRMDKALMEVFDKVAMHSADNRHNVEAWKSNSHFLLTKKFIVPSYNRDSLLDDMQKALCYITGKEYNDCVSLDEFMRYDFFLVDKAGRFLNNKEYDHPVKHSWHAYQVRDGYHERAMKQHPGSELLSSDVKTLYGSWFDWGFFRVKKFKKGTMHLEFKDENVWVLFNKNIARIMGYPLFEGKEQTAYQKRNSGQKTTA